MAGKINVLCSQKCVKIKCFVTSNRMQFSHRTCIVPEGMILALDCTKYNNGRTRI